MEKLDDLDTPELEKLDFRLQVRDLSREVVLTVRALDDKTFKALADGAKILEKEIKDEIKQKKS